MPIYDRRDMRLRNPSPLYRQTSQATDTHNAQPVAPLSLARTATDEYAAEAAPAPLGVQVAQPTGGNDFYGEQLGALEQSLRGMPQQVQQYNDQRSASYDEQEAALRQHMSTLQQPQGSQVLGRLGAALMAPTSTGSFFEAYGKATNAALDQRSLEDRVRQANEEKLHHARIGLARLAGDRAVNPMDQMRDQFTMMKTANEVDDMRGDYDLRREIGNGTTPQGDEALLADARANPNKYRSPRGQQMVADAQGRLSTVSDRQWELDKMREQNRLDILKQDAKRGTAGGAMADLTPSEEKMVATSHGNVLATQDNLQLLDEADRLDSSGLVMGGYAPKAFAAAGKIAADYGVPQDYLLPDWLFGSPEQQAATQEYYQVLDPASLERIKASLPGVMTDRDLRFALGVYADPSATPQARQQARTTIRSRFQAQDKVARAQLQRLLGPEGSAELLGEADGGQGDGGNQRYLTPEQGSTLKQAIQHAQQSNAYGGVAKRLNEMGFGITPEQLKQLTPEQVDQLIKSGQ